MSMDLRLLVALSVSVSLVGCFDDPPSSSSSTASDSSTGSAQSTTDAASTTEGAEESTETADPSSSGIGTAAGSSSSTGSPGLGESSTGRDTMDTDEPMPGCPPGSPFLFLIFEGIELLPSGLDIDNAPEAIVGDPALAGVYGPYDEDDREELLELVRGHFAPAGICVTDQRPPTPDFDMIVVTTDTLGDGNALGFPNLDCGNTAQNNVNVVFFSSKVNLGTTARAIAL